MTFGDLLAYGIGIEKDLGAGGECGQFGRRLP